MRSFSLTNAAKADLRSIARLTEERWGREQRMFYLNGMDDVFRRLADSSTLGVSCEYIASDLRKYPFQSHVIYYEPWIRFGLSRPLMVAQTYSVGICFEPAG